MSDIKVDDVVQFKSGGPKMTVEKIGEWSTVRGRLEIGERGA